jgi:hypothetical protein
MADINGLNEYDYDGYTARNSGLLEIATHVATVRERRAFRHLQRLWGLICDVYFPVSGDYDPYTRTGSVYARDDQKYNYKNEPSLYDVNLVFSNLMDLTRMDAVTRMDILDMRGDIFAYTNLEKEAEDGGKTARKCMIPMNSKIMVRYNNKLMAFFVWSVSALDSPYEDDGKAIYKLELKPHV